MFFISFVSWLVARCDNFSLLFFSVCLCLSPVLCVWLPLSSPHVFVEKRLTLAGNMFLAFPGEDTTYCKDRWELKTRLNHSAWCLQSPLDMGPRCVLANLVFRIPQGTWRCLRGDALEVRHLYNIKARVFIIVLWLWWFKDTGETRSASTK